MPTVNARIALLAAAVVLLTACASKAGKQGNSGNRPLHELFSQQETSPSAAHSADARAQSATNRPAAPAPSVNGWPITLKSDDATFRVHEPVVDSWASGIVTGRAVVVAEPQALAGTTPGWVTIKALTEVQPTGTVVALVNTEVLGVTFPSGTDKSQAWQEFLRFAVPPKITSLPLAALELGRNVDESRRNAAASTIKAPRIIVSERPAILVYIDGDTRYVRVPGTSLKGVLNTRVVLLKDPDGTYYLHLYDGWVSASSLDGQWKIAPAPPVASGIEQAARASGRANLLTGKPQSSEMTPSLSDGRLPDILVTHEPTALIVLDGAPRYASAAWSGLQYVVNTSARLLRSTETGNAYVCVDGAWFTASDINATWSRAQPATLPSEFSAIPCGSATAASQSLAVADRRTATLSMSMDGDPVLEPIPGTSLNYVANASVPVIQVDINNWYAVQGGIWFSSTEATGPWTVTNRVPPQIYSIPPGVPIYDAIHSRVLASSTDVTYYGYPGPGSLLPEGGAAGMELQGDDYQYTPPSGLHWGWFY
jgi:hypothetical protein